MSAPRCDYLDETHPAFRASPEVRADAAHALFEEALSGSTRFRLEFDRERLLAALGPSDAAALLPTLPARPPPGPADVHDESLDDDRRALLLRALSFRREKWADPPLTYIDRVVLFDAGAQVVLRANDSAEFILFALPEPARGRLVERYRASGIPEDVITQVDVDIEQGIARGA
jgi:hypothetical protein